MKIALVHGQNHKGSTYNIARLLTQKISGENEIKEFFLPRDLNHFCLGCYKCIEDFSACPFYDEKKQITDALCDADILIFTTPNYCMNMSAPLKAFVDLTFTFWMSHSPRECMFKKRAVVLSTAAGIGTRQSMKGVRTTLFYWGVPKIYTYGRSIQAMNWDGVSEKHRAKIDKSMTKLAKKLENKKNPLVGIKTRFIFKMMSLMQKAGWGSSKVEKQYWQDNGWLDKARPWK